MNQYALYLRKSRADMEAESRGEGETLAKHRAALTELARRRGLLIVREYAEIISGDSIAARPQMQALLEDVKRGMYAGVIVNDVDRLGRGDSIDQEIIKVTFAATHTLIITPLRDIDPANPSDDQMLDFSMFLARAEYKISARRLAQGRERSALAGNWIAGSAPFGYRKIRHGKHLTLEPDNNAPIARMIFDWYASGEAGYIGIANRLARMGISFGGTSAPNPSCIKRMLQNPVYIGCLRWGRTKTASTIEDGRRVKHRIKCDAPQIVEGVFPAIIARDTWDAVQDRVNQARHASPVNANAVMQNPLSGLIYCAECGRAMVRIQGKHRPILRCVNPHCVTSGAYLDVVEAALLDVLRGWSAEYIDTPPEQPDNASAIDALRHQLDGIAAQMARAYELVETGVYTTAEYIQRKTALDARKTALDAEIDKLSRPTPEAAKWAILPAVRRVMDVYPHAVTAEDKNRLLRSVVQRVEYHKTKKGGPLMLDVYPCISI